MMGCPNSVECCLTFFNPLLKIELLLLSSVYRFSALNFGKNSTILIEIREPDQGRYLVHVISVVFSSL